MRIRAVDRYEGGNIAVVADHDPRPLAIHLRHAANVDVFAELGIADHPDQRMETILPEGGVLGEQLVEFLEVH
jgi:hypothetical protein